MKKQIRELAAVERAQLEEAYHQMNPADLDELMAHATSYQPVLFHLPEALVTQLKALAEVTGESGYQTMICRWIEERLQQEARLALRIAKQAKPKAIAVLARRGAKKTVRTQTI
ncbi:MAG: hypothetical protein HYR56_06335 [Acidobacteria bacterium]|nr:hypothetical protein [Acidobacteriota bacterium]MBI3422247.1 hypothetical protein [Acidobacteriota bacterium]